MHCDKEIHNDARPACLRYFLLVHRMPAVDRAIIETVHDAPKCFADHDGKRVRLTMASRFGDVGISPDLASTRTSYKTRVEVSDLSNFSEQP